MGDREVAVKVSGRRQAKMTERKVKTKRSNWFFTLSTNKRYKDDDEAIENDEACLEEAIVEVLENIGDFMTVQVADHSWSNKHIHDVTTDYVIERGPTTKALHAHILIKVEHTSNIKLEYGKIKQHIMDILGLDNLYCNAKLVKPTSDDYILSYLDKNR
jgi:hypothetical protein